MEEQIVKSNPATTTPIGLTATTRLNGKKRTATSPSVQARSSLTFEQISDHPQARISSGYGELDRVLGGGIVPGSLVLIGGDPGIGKSTLLLQVANQLGHQHRILYVCAEESGQQVKLRSQRLGIGHQPPIQMPQRSVEEAAAATGAPGPNLYVLPETDLETVLAELESLKPTVAVIDSIQALYYSALGSAP
ncbi:MAG TPA: ATPase domain-containing protein, partial [Candidatus Obscuribacterales bacterium]